MSQAPRRRVLIVEDESIVARDLQFSLEDLGYAVCAIAASSDEAIALTREHNPDLILMDVRICGKRDGIDTAQVIRNEMEVPVVYLTAHADDATLARAKLTEPSGYLLKPVRSGELRCTVEIALYRDEADRKFRERKRWFETTLCSIADCVVTVDLEGNVQFMNAAAEELLGVSSFRCVGRPVLEVLGTPNEEGHRGASVVEMLQGGDTGTLSTSVVNQTTGKLRHVTARAAPVAEEGQQLGVVIVIRDMTEQLALRRQVERADRLSSLGTMAAGVAHEINNPLSVVTANAAYVLENIGKLAEGLDSSGELREEIETALRELWESAARVGRIVGGLKSFARPADEHAARGPVSLKRSIEWALRATSQELRPHAQVVLDDGEFDEVCGDQQRLEQVLVNLLLNAAQAIPAGNPAENKIYVSVKGWVDGQICVEVQDTGVGIPESVIAHVFDPFFTTKDVGVGTGLGLSICRGLMQSMGGDIDLDSEEGVGTTVRLFLKSSSRGVRESSPPSGRQSVRKTRVLVVDDEPMVLRAIQRILSEHDLVCRDRATAALDVLRAGEEFDLILSDVMMPGMTGIEFYECLLRDDATMAAKVVFVTGGANTRETEEFLRSIPNGHIEKPFDSESVRALLEGLDLDERASLPLRPN